MTEIKIDGNKVISTVNGSTQEVFRDCVYAYYILGQIIRKVTGCSIETALNLIHELTLNNSNGLNNADTTVIDLSGVKRKNDKD